MFQGQRTEHRAATGGDAGSARSVAAGLARARFACARTVLDRDMALILCATPTVSCTPRSSASRGQRGENGLGSSGLQGIIELLVTSETTMKHLAHG
jgi:hypothetical protein